MELTGAEVRNQLDRVVASEGFANADRMSRFLRFVVERTLAGESDAVKEYVIGVEVFGRDDTYDPRLDAIVRVEARRLRSKIDEYYAREGAHDPILIQIRRGSYVPTFERRSPAPVAAAVTPSAPVTVQAAAQAMTTRPRRGVYLGIGILAIAVVLLAFAGLWATARPAPDVTIAVLPFSQYSTDPADALLAARLTEGITGELARLGTLRVVSHTNAMQFAGARPTTMEIAQRLHAEMIVEGSVSREAGQVRVSTRLVDGAIGYKAWADAFEGSPAEIPALQRRIAAALAAAATRPRK